MYLGSGPLRDAPSRFRGAGREPRRKTWWRTNMRISECLKSADAAAEGRVWEFRNREELLFHESIHTPLNFGGIRIKPGQVGINNGYELFAFSNYLKIWLGFGNIVCSPNLARSLILQINKKCWWAPEWPEIRTRTANTPLEMKIHSLINCTGFRMNLEQEVAIMFANICLSKITIKFYSNDNFPEARVFGFPHYSSSTLVDSLQPARKLPSSYTCKDGASQKVPPDWSKVAKTVLFSPE
jgi:hypothetical protein